MKNLLLLSFIVFTQIGLAQDYPKTLPEFKIFTTDNQAFSQDEVNQKNYAYFVYFNPECSHCQIAFKTLNLNVDRLKDIDVKLYPVSANSKAKTMAFFENYGPKLMTLKNMQILLDDNYNFADAFFVGAYPTSYLYDENLKLVKVFNGAGDIMGFLDEIK